MIVEEKYVIERGVQWGSGPENIYWESSAGLHYETPESAWQIAVPLAENLGLPENLVRVVKVTKELFPRV